MKAHLKIIIEKAGGKSMLAKKCEVSPAYVSKWIREGRIPAPYCRACEYITKGEITAEMLDPRVFKPSFRELIAIEQ